jgi:hypothetical protein
MLGHLYVHTPEEYETWKAEKWPPAMPAAADSANVETPQQ